MIQAWVKSNKGKPAGVSASEIPLIVYVPPVISLYPKA